MTKLNFNIIINASKQKVWNVLWDDASYRKWTSAFCEGSYAVTDNWRVGSKVLFLAPNGSGVVSSVATNRQNEFMSFKHVGWIKDGIEDLTSEKVMKWSGAMENYSLQEANGVTTLIVEIDVLDEEKEYFINSFPKALELVKSLTQAGL